MHNLLMLTYYTLPLTRLSMENHSYSYSTRLLSLMHDIVCMEDPVPGHIR